MKSIQLNKIPLIYRIIIAILLGVFCSYIFPIWAVRLFTTFSALFGTFLDFVIPLIILGLVAPSIAELGQGSGKLLLSTVALAYASTIIAGFISYFVSVGFFPSMVVDGAVIGDIAKIDGAIYASYFTVEIPAVISVMGALVLSFLLGLSLMGTDAIHIRGGLNEFRDVILRVIHKVIIPMLPLFIFSIFLKMSVMGEVAVMLGLFVKVIAVIFVVHVLWLVLQYSIAGAIVGRNPFKLLLTMMPAYFTALGTQSSAATIPITMQQTITNGVRRDVAGFVIPLCATIHLSGSILKIVACAIALMFMYSMEVNLTLIAGFIFSLSVAMVAAPGVPGGAIMAALGLLSSILGFDDQMAGMMIALYITMDSFGTACNVTGDGAIALIIDKYRD